MTEVVKDKQTSSDETADDSAEEKASKHCASLSLTCWPGLSLAPAGPYIGNVLNTLREQGLFLREIVGGSDSSFSI